MCAEGASSQRLGRAHAALGDYQRAIQDHDDAFVLHPGDPGIYHSRQDSFEELGRKDL